ncbi:MAG: 30S ribosomal protein S6 [Candidatus Omnitrophota bacterium]|nr:MAG: 30S ribosomal protein S6 [Candidatus Omnitrophota bacterium]
MAKTYESMLILKDDLTDEAREETFDKIVKKIESLEGKVFASRIWAKERNFYYPIRSRGAEKKKYHKGCYWFLHFNIDTTRLADLREAIRLEERILRNIIIQKDDQIKARLTERPIRQT